MSRRSRLLLSHSATGQKDGRLFREPSITGLRDRGSKWAFISVECPLCAGKASDLPMCWGRIGTLKEGLFWLTGKEFDVEEVECRALGASACVWEVSKTPKE